MQELERNSLYLSKNIPAETRRNVVLSTQVYEKLKDIQEATKQGLMEVGFYLYGRVYDNQIQFDAIKISDADIHETSTGMNENDFKLLDGVLEDFHDAKDIVICDGHSHPPLKQATYQQKMNFSGADINHYRYLRKYVPDNFKVMAVLLVDDEFNFIDISRFGMLKKYKNVYSQNGEKLPAYFHEDEEIQHLQQLIDNQQRR
jgi:hypothetical protein